MISSQTPVVLPSIHEMFPEYLMNQPAHSRMPRTSISSPRSSPFSHPYSSAFHAESRRYSTVVDSAAQQHPSYSPRATCPAPSESSHSARQHRNSFSSSSSSASPEFSFNVLRSDPASSSLQHIASSASFHNQTSHPHSRHHHHPSSSSISSSSSAGGYDQVSFGSAPAFRVSIPESSRIPISPTSSTASPLACGPSSIPRLPRNPHHPGTDANTASETITRKSELVRSHRHPSPPGSSAYSTLSFPVSGADAAGPSPAFVVGGVASAAAALATSPRDRSPNDDLGDNAASDGEFSSNGKKHVCPTCSKRFNRPSSLRIHVNTHTGATPFRCPWPDCGREFNVNSNMRRHYRNHTTPGFSRPPPAASPVSVSVTVPPPQHGHAAGADRRRKRRIAPQGLVFIDDDAVSTSHTQHQHHLQQQQTPISRLSPSSASDGDDGASERYDEDGDDEEEIDELSMDVDGEELPPRSSPSGSSASSSSRSHSSIASFQRFSQSDVRSTDGAHSPSYPSYARVSTTLRPALGGGAAKAEA